LKLAGIFSLFINVSPNHPNQLYTMAGKENKGGVLTNEQVEQDLKAKAHGSEDSEAYIGSQDTGDKEVRHLGNEVNADAEDGE
jgi:hypothetical protein